ncbi:MAG: RnfABCDGE type electron transport complex subunit D [Anaerovoracaceae bacterium]|jgi:electron transport complex protein RnfD
MSNKLNVTYAPHIIESPNTQKIMLTVLISLIPAMIVAVYQFGVRALLLTIFCAVVCVFFEWLFNRITGKPQTIADCSAIVTGVLLAYNLPASFPFWMAAIGCFTAIFIAKCLFGGIGQNFVNPALTGRIVLFVSFATEMTTWPTPRGLSDQAGYDTATHATALGIFNETHSMAGTPHVLDLFLGNCGGSLGEVSALALLIGGLILIFTKVISPVTPIAFIGTVAVLALAAGQNPLWHICAGGVMLGAFFMATDYATTPSDWHGKIIFGVGCGIITMGIRLFGAYPEGVSFSIIVMNIITPFIDNWCNKKFCGGDLK